MASDPILDKFNEFYKCFDGNPGWPYLQFAVCCAIATGGAEALGMIMMLSPDGESGPLAIGGAIIAMAKLGWFVSILAALLGLIQFHHQCGRWTGEKAKTPEQ